MNNQVIPNINKPTKSNRFGAISMYWQGVHYFPGDIKESNKRNGRPFEIQGVYFRGKLYQDTFYITKEVKDLLIESL
tara:strand:+ start:1271 stop:1501 length:231 start_codon:yes stop_codon:yes gene_type:complete